MMKKVVYNCDNCKQEFDVLMSETATSANTVDIKVGDLGKDYDVIGFDICKKCRLNMLEVFERRALYNMETIER